MCIHSFPALTFLPRPDGLRLARAWFQKLIISEIVCLLQGSFAPEENVTECRGISMDLDFMDLELVQIEKENMTNHVVSA